MKNLIKDEILESFDKSFTSKISIQSPDKYSQLELTNPKKIYKIAKGSGLSYAPLSFSKNSHVVEMKKLNKILNFNKKKKTIEVEAGTIIGDILNFILPKNLWIPQLPGYPLISIGGAIATNAHGKNAEKYGTIRNNIIEILLYNQNQGWLKLSRKKNKKIFDLTIGGLGLTGIIVKVKLKLTPIKSTHFNTKIIKFDNFFKLINFLKKKNKKIIYSWHDGSNLDRCLIFESEAFKEKKIKQKNEFYNKKKYPLIKIWNKFTIKLINRLFYIYQIVKKNKVESFSKILFPYYGNELYFSFYGKKGFIESQFLLKYKNLEKFWEEFENIKKNIKPVIFFLSIKKIKGNQTYLRFEDNGLIFTINLPRNENNIIFIKRIHEIFKKHDVIPNLAKDSLINNKNIRKYFPELKKFVKELKKFDPKRTYRSTISNKFGL
jgi:decaprenylphospho-beta-D-ribofuranose 2-oxidase